MEGLNFNQMILKIFKLVKTNSPLMLEFHYLNSSHEVYFDILDCSTLKLCKTS